MVGNDEPRTLPNAVDKPDSDIVAAKSPTGYLFSRGIARQVAAFCEPSTRPSHWQAVDEGRRVVIQNASE